MLGRNRKGWKGSCSNKDQHLIFSARKGPLPVERVEQSILSRQVAFRRRKGDSKEKSLDGTEIE